MSRCDQAREWILSELEGDSSDEEALKAHAADCPDCAAYAAEMRVLLVSLKGLEAEAPPIDLTDRVMARVARARTPEVVQRRVFSRKSATVAAAIALMALATPFVLNAPKPPAPETSAVVARGVERAAMPPSKGENVATASGEQAAEKRLSPVEEVKHSVSKARSASFSASGQAVTASPPPESEPSAVIVPEEPLIVASAFSGEEEGDLYYDPLSEWVGF